ncbi:MAG: aminotransferase class III-fold pyridoxal phosphate-dependent enzyme [Planctomycetia bacterium]|nr:aminotransferase class III-fold pyridoxal phosphate-dependent enzyme [Planctomycetia bacterium]
MRFGFLVHPLSEESAALVELNDGGTLAKHWGGGNLLDFCNFLHETMSRSREHGAKAEPRVRVIDHLPGLVSATGQVCEGRLYEIPMGAVEILDDPVRAMTYMEQAVQMAAEWGAGIIGLGSMTGVVGGQGTFLAERSPVPVTTGNSLTVFAAIENLRQACREAEIDLSRETVAVVGIPGSIAAAAARILAPEVGELLLVARRTSARATKLSAELDAELFVELPPALARARVIVSATSTGNCIDQKALRLGSIVVDVGVPADVQGSSPERDDVLIISGGLALVPDSMPRDSMFLGFHHGMVPSCLGETMNLALEGRGECFSLGRDLSPEGIREIGAIALKHGFNFGRLLSFGLVVEDSQLARYRKAVTRQRLLSIGAAPAKQTAAPQAVHGNGNGAAHTNGHAKNGQNGYAENGHAGANGEANGHYHESRDEPSSEFYDEAHVDEQAPLGTPAELAPRAASLHGRYINPVLIAVSGRAGFARTFVRGRRNTIWDSEGQAYLDFVAGFGSMNLGHNHPRVADAIRAALEHEAPGYAQSAVNPYAPALAELLVAISPPGLEMVFFANSGTEAVEACLKLARLATGRTALLHCERSYHGKSLGALSVTGNPTYQKPFGPLLPDCHSVPYGDLDALTRALSGRKFAALMIEPLQGEGGMVVPPSGYLRAAQDLCRRAGTLLIVDEVQTGLGRTGAMFASDREGIEPDLMALAKSLGGGLMPIGAMLCRRDVWQKAYGTMHTFALHTSTFGGGSLACAAGLAAVKALIDERLAENAQLRGEQLRAGLEKIQRSTDRVIKEVRGAGLMLGLELYPLRPSLVSHWKQTDATGLMQYMVPNIDLLAEGVTTMYLMQTLLTHHGIYTQVARSNPNVLRVQPPLTIEAAEVERFLTAVDQTCREIEASSGLVDGLVSKTVAGQHTASGATLTVQTLPRVVTS